MSSLPLQVAIASGQLDAVRSLLTNGADANLVDTKHGTALRTAAASGNIEIVKLILNECVEVNEDGPYGTALDCAATEDIRNLLRNHGAKTDRF
jgi:hypothetical protein